jgi:hypothetical protein
MKLNQLIFLGSITLGLAALAGPAPAGVALLQNQVSRVSQTTTTSTLARSAATILATGTFVGAEKPTTGIARIVREGNKQYLELDKAFSTSNQGPDLHVLLDESSNPPKTYKDKSGITNLGKLRSYTGAQRYSIPSSVNLSTVKSVVIWCRMANATFGYAPLAAK